VDCGAKIPMRVRFYDVGQALATLVTLPDGRHILVDAGERPARAGCGTVCRTKHEHLLDELEHDLGGDPISMLWVTHQHSDHVGGTPGVLEKFKVEVYVDNGQALGKTQVKTARALARARGAELVAVDPAQPRSPIRGSGPALKIRPVLPAAWTSDCEDEPNSCSIGLRIDYCQSSVLFTGDAEADEEQDLEPYGKVTVLQVGHHGSDTSSSSDFLAKVSPKYAVISTADRGEGLNKTYCHPRAATVAALNSALGGEASATVAAFDGSVSCTKATDATWRSIPTSERMWVTSRDGDVTLTTTGDGVFVRE
jgi:competence protein ComEC